MDHSGWGFRFLVHGHRQKAGGEHITKEGDGRPLRVGEPLQFEPPLRIDERQSVLFDRRAADELPGVIRGVVIATKNGCTGWRSCDGSQP